MKLALTLLLGILVTSTAHGGIVTVAFEGEVSDLIDGGVDVGSVFSVGQSISGTFSYDDTVTDSSGVANTGWFNDAVVGLSVNVAGYSVGFGAGSSGRVRTSNDISLNGIAGDLFNVFLIDPVAADVDGAPIWNFDLTIFDTDETVYALNSDAKSLSPTYDFSAFDFPTGQTFDLSMLYRIQVGFDDQQNEPIFDTGFIRGLATSAHAIPEPTSAALLAIGGVALLRRRVRASRVRETIENTPMNGDL